jgi:hypothetical protein
MNDEKFPVEGYCFLINKKDDVNKTLELARDISKLVKFCCAKNIPHNLIFTQGSSPEEIRIFFFPRTTKSLGVEKVYGDMTVVAFCELSGYVPEGSDYVFYWYDEHLMLDVLREHLGDVAANIEEDVVRLY